MRTRILATAAWTLVILATGSLLECNVVFAKKSPSRPARAAIPTASARSSTGTGLGNRKGSSSAHSNGRPPVSRRRSFDGEDEGDFTPDDEDIVDEDEVELAADLEQDLDDEAYDDYNADGDAEDRSPKRRAARSPPPASRTARDTAIHRPTTSRKRPPQQAAAASARRQRDYDDFEEEEQEELDYEDDDEEYGQVDVQPRRRPPDSPTIKRQGPPPRRDRDGPPARPYPAAADPRRGRPGPKHQRPQPQQTQRRRQPPPQSARRGDAAGRGRVVPYGARGPGPAQAAAATFTRGLTALRSSLPDPAVVRDVAVSSFNSARETTSNLSSNLYRDIKGLTSSELEQVMLKATRPDDSPVKGKHVERLVGVTYQISTRYDIYDAVLRKLWSKMVEKDWRTTIKSLYILHRFSADGAPEHAAALKAKLREMRRTRDAKRKDKYFNSKQLLAGDTKPENIKFRAFMSRYSHYVFLRAQCFGGMFDEIGTLPKVDKKKPQKPITSTCLRAEHLDAAGLLLNAGMACQLKDGEECENTAIAVERVASDLIGLTSAVAVALNRALKESDGNLNGADPALIQKWCIFYSQELLPKTRAMVKKTSSRLDAYGLFLPSRMGTSVAPDILERGLHLVDQIAAAATSPDPEEKDDQDGDNEIAVVAKAKTAEGIKQSEQHEQVDSNTVVAQTAEALPKQSVGKVADLQDEDGGELATAGDDDDEVEEQQQQQVVKEKPKKTVSKQQSEGEEAEAAAAATAAVAKKAKTSRTEAVADDVDEYEYEYEDEDYYDDEGEEE